MGVKEDLKALANSILDSYEMRVRMVNALMDQSYHFFKDYQLELEEMREQLKDNLARAESLRKRDFDRMMRDVTERRRSQEEEAEDGDNLPTQEHHHLWQSLNPGRCRDHQRRHPETAKGT
jgi:hypothetical protein